MLFNRDTVDLLKQDGTRVSGIPCTVDSSMVYMKADHRVDPGDLIFRAIPNGAEETYQVIDPVFYKGTVGIGPHYQIKVKKLGIPEARSAVQHITYTVTGNNARVNVNSVDNSINVVHVQSDVAEQIETIMAAIRTANLSNEEKAEAVEAVEEVKSQFASGAPKRSVVRSLLNGLPKALEIGASIATILSALPG
ncbi:hypothetical protein ABL840_26780 [Variovorax sp. NFACC27]|uniref:hypothetical protein n=1 Tax=unclassified Variovorax TaxID=663243 RepID=UPI000899C026|nr:hypothetical protein SAMN03159371_03693 [Variovorax sp. NFACC28]SEG78085.1 hypothetical protein SAMN03159365_03772 [Variovorax sp. NFACC29]SFC95992.1 hypothetical protein SAMN03159379_03651 [Variovorax sp. NFACC26]SFG09096.1 hypothetical protein SAMN03159447_01759 [Variovorax sp. NFACC27]